MILVDYIRFVVLAASTVRMLCRTGAVAEDWVHGAEGKNEVNTFNQGPDAAFNIPMQYWLLRRAAAVFAALTARA